MATNYTELQLDALREAANIGSGNAATALSNLLRRPVAISQPSARALPLAEAIDEVGDAGMLTTGVLLLVEGDLEALVLLLFTPAEAAALCELLGVQDPAWRESALGEVGNILGCSYINALAAMTGMSAAPRPPETVSDMLGAIVSTALVAGLRADDLAILMNSKLDVDGSRCGFAFLFVPAIDGADRLLDRLGVG